MADADAYTIPAMTTVTITMDLDEATTLRDILMKVGGHPDTSRRGHASKVLRALERVNEVAVVPTNVRDIRANTSGIEFLEQAARPERVPDWENW